MNAGTLLANGKYEVVRTLGRGGMGEVLLAHDRTLGRDVAVKRFLIRGELEQFREHLRTRFNNEARILARLRHPHIVRVIEVFEHAGQPCLAMEYLEGETLAQIIADGDWTRRRAQQTIKTPLDVEQSIAWAIQLCEGLAHAHARGLIHRDIKPANLMIDEHGTLQVLDFGIAKIDASFWSDAGAASGSGGVVASTLQFGSNNYMAPEQIDPDKFGGGRLDPRVDVWAVGLVLYELIARVRAFPREGNAALIDICTETPRAIAELAPGTPATLIAIVERALQKNRDRRFSSAAEMGDRLKEVAASLTPVVGANASRAPAGHDTLGATAPASRPLRGARRLAEDLGREAPEQRSSPHDGASPRTAIGRPLAITGVAATISVLSWLLLAYRPAPVPQPTPTPTVTNQVAVLSPTPQPTRADPLPSPTPTESSSGVKSTSSPITPSPPAQSPTPGRTVAVSPPSPAASVAPPMSTPSPSPIASPTAAPISTPAPSPTPSTKAEGGPSPAQREDMLWATIKDSRTAPPLEDYLARVARQELPGLYKAAAEAKLQELRTPPVRPSPSSPLSSPSPSPPPPRSTPPPVISSTPAWAAGWFSPVTVGQAGKDVVYVPTPFAVVEKMLDLARVTSQDYVVDLGSGDGRVVVAAAKRGARAMGIEYNQDLVDISKRNAATAGVGDRVGLFRGDLFTEFDTKNSKATVITMFLLPSLNMKLRPSLLEMRPGTRIVTNTFTMEDWEADEQQTIADCSSWCTALLWIVPAKVEGVWQTTNGELKITQRFQQVSGSLNGRPISAGKLRGAQLTFKVGDAAYTGQVEGDQIKGTGAAGGWSATRGASRSPREPAVAAPTVTSQRQAITIARVSVTDHDLGRLKPGSSGVKTPVGSADIIELAGQKWFRPFPFARSSSILFHEGLQTAGPGPIEVPLGEQSFVVRIDAEFERVQFRNALCRGVLTVQPGVTGYYVDVDLRRELIGGVGVSGSMFVGRVTCRAESAKR